VFSSLQPHVDVDVVGHTVLTNTSQRGDFEAAVAVQSLRPPDLATARRHRAVQRHVLRFAGTTRTPRRFSQRHGAVASALLTVSEVQP